MTSNQYTLLPFAVIKISGPDSEKFLQGQLSCDVSTLNEGDTTYGTANTAKGRVYAVFTLTLINNAYYMRMHESIVQSALDTLSKYKVFFKCDMTIENALKVYGARTELNSDAGSNLNTTPASNSMHYSDGTFTRLLPDGTARTEIWTSAEQSLSANQSEDLNTWFAEDCLQGIPEVYPETQDNFVLQQINLQELGAVSFNKGCYTGQEIIARMKFLGKLKKKTFYFKADTQFSATPSDAIFSADGKKLGQVVRIHHHNGATVGLALCDITAASESATVYLDSASKMAVALSELHYKTD